MRNNKDPINYLSITLICVGLTACGGGAGTDPNSYKATLAGQGSTVVDAENSGTISYSQYQLMNIAMPDKEWVNSFVSASLSFNASSKAGSIQFPVLGKTATMSTNDGYATILWSGPFTAGAYKFKGNILMGCNTGATIPTEATQIFVSSSLTRIEGAAPLDDLKGLTFDVIDCTSKVDALKFNTDGTLTMSMTKSVATQDQMINMLNPEKWGGALVDNKYFGGHLFRYGSSGANKYAIVMQTSTGNFNSKYRYFLAVQR